VAEGELREEVERRRRVHSGGDLGKKASDRWADFNAAPGASDVLPFDVLRPGVKPVLSAVNATS